MPIRRPGESGSQESDLPTQQGQEKRLTTKSGQESGSQESNSTTRITKEAKCQESDPAARSGGGQEARSGRSPSVPRATSLEPIQEERAGRGEQERLGQGPLAAEGASRGTPLAQEAGGKGPVRVCVEKWENLFGASTSVERSKRQRTSSLSSLHPTTPTFARTFQSSSQPTGTISRLAVNKSVSECNLSQWVGRPSLGGQAVAGAQELSLITNYLGIKRAGRSTSLGPDTTRTSVADRGEKQGRLGKI